MDNLSINLVQGPRAQPRPAMRKECKIHHPSVDHHKGKDTSVTTVVKMDMVCISAPTRRGIMGMVKEEDPEDK